MGHNGPVGVFDSGVGGLSVLRAIRAELPGEDVVYVADSGHAPYGDRSGAFIEGRSLEIAGFLHGIGSKAIVIACNTATGVAAGTLRSRFTCPIVAMEPAVKPAAAVTKTGVVGVLATTRTLDSDRFLKLVDEHAGSARVLVQPCPGLAEQVERAEFTSARTRALVEAYVLPLRDQGADTLVLGCTHYAFLRPVIEEVAGPTVSLLDPAVAVARELRRRLESADLLAAGRVRGTEAFWTSGSRDEVAAVIGQLWGRPVTVQALPERAA